MNFRIKNLLITSDQAISKNIITLALPVIASNLSRVFMSMTNVAMVERLGATALAATSTEQ